MLRMVSAGLLGDKERRCGMCKDDKCELCDECVVEDVHFLLNVWSLVIEEDYWA